MSVYTTVDRPQLEAFLREYALGELVSHRGISEGISNTNYFVTTTRGEYVLTLFELIGFDDVPYYLELMAYLAERGVPSAHPLPDHGGRYMRALNGKPAALVHKLAGCGIDGVPTQQQCRAIGTALARLHLAGADFPLERPNDRGPDWWAQAAARVLPRMDPADAALLEDELAYQAANPRAALPQGVVHADLFRDNALFDGDALGGLIDFYYACSDAYAYDVAVTVNDWCSRPDGSLDPARAEPLLEAYLAVRPFTALERAEWSTMLRAGALRFWLSRLVDQLFPTAGELTFIKDPDEFKRILLAQRAAPWAL